MVTINKLFVLVSSSLLTKEAGEISYSVGMRTRQDISTSVANTRGMEAIAIQITLKNSIILSHGC